MQCEYRIYEFNRRLASSQQQQQYMGFELDMQWWDAFITDFFDDDSTLTIKVFEDRMRVYSKSL